jgi:hypothetical protein
MACLGLPQSDDTILRSLKPHVRTRHGVAEVRVVGIDDWAWQKGRRYGTITVDRSAEPTGRWLGDERSFAWFNKFRRLTICYERRIDIHHAFTFLACSLLCPGAFIAGQVFERRSRVNFPILKWNSLWRSARRR